MDSLDPEARIAIEKMMFDRVQEARGLPTLEELERQKNIERLKKMHPNVDFSGFDFSKAKFSFK